MTKPKKKQWQVDEVYDFPIDDEFLDEEVDIDDGLDEWGDRIDGRLFNVTEDQVDDPGYWINL